MWSLLLNYAAVGVLSFDGTFFSRKKKEVYIYTLSSWPVTSYKTITSEQEIGKKKLSKQV
jgi:hypothetical protein